MKVTFILPCVGRNGDRAYPRSWLMEPLTIATLAGLTPPQIEREFYDDRLEPIPYDTPTDLVAITVETYTARRAYQIAAEYRRRGRAVVMGGYHATLVPDDVAPHADAVVVGAAEGVWPRLLQDAEKGRLQPVYHSDASVEATAAQPDRSIFRGRPYMDLGLVETARGCAFHCEFCSITAFHRGRYKPRPITDVVTDVASLRQKYVFFVDDNICVDRSRARALFEALKPLRVRWAGQVSINIAEDESLVRLMRDSGCIGVLVGFESLSDANLTAMGKQTNADPADYPRQLAVLRKHGIAVYGTFVFGYDADTPATFEQTLHFARRNKLFFAAFNHLVPFPGTPVYERLRHDGRLPDENWWMSATYRFGDVAFRPNTMPATELAQRCLACRHRFYSPASVLQRATDLRANCRSPHMALLFFAQNIGSGREVDLRQGLPLGCTEHARNALAPDAPDRPSPRAPVGQHANA